MQVSNHGGRKSSIKRRHIFGCLIVLLAAAVVVSVAAFVMTELWRSEPSYWQQYQTAKVQIPPAQRLYTAERFESRMVTQISADEQLERTITLHLDDINAWLDQRLERWLANQGLSLPPEVGDVMVTSQGGNLVLAFYVQTERIEQVFSMFFDLSVNDADQAQLKLKAIRGGRLRVPGDMVLDLVNQAAPGEALDVLMGRETIEPILQIDNSRQLRIRAIDVFDDRIEMRVVTEEQ